MSPLPTLRQLQFFVALARRKSFSKAAEDCLVSQSTLSSAIKELEVMLDCQLVDRSTRHFSLTLAGEDAVSRATEILAHTEDLSRAVSSRRPLEGPFHLGVIPTIAPFLLPIAAPAIKKAYPDLSLYLREDLTANLADRLSAGLIDAALLAFPVDLPGVDHIDVGEDPFYLAVPKDDPLADRKSVRLEDLSETNLLLLEDGHCLRDHAIEACKLQTPASAATFSATSLLTLAHMTQSGLGATLLPKMAVDTGLAASVGLAVTPFEAPEPKRRIGLAWRGGSSRREEVMLLATILEETLSGLR